MIRMETERLILRDVDIEKDLSAWTDMMSDAETVQFIGGQTLDEAGSWRQIATMIRKGYAKEAGAACVKYAFEELGWERVIHVIAAENIASIKTAEAIGSKKMYHIPNLPPFGEVNCWAYGQDKE